MNPSGTETSATPGAAGEGLAETGVNTHDVYLRIGTLTRKLHDALRELGYVEAIESAVSSLPDARARLGYIERLTGEAAERVLAAAEASKEIQARLAHSARELTTRWPAMSGSAAAGETLASVSAFLAQVQQQTGETNTHLTEIMLAQGFHDLTGQVLKRVVTVAETLEQQLVNLLLDATPPEQRARLTEESSLAGPVMEAAGRDDVVTSQGQVDDLLESLGF